MDTTEKFCLRWNDFESNISGALKELREDKDFFDVTLACDDNQMEAHKVIISACSPFFRTILRRNKHEHPLLYLKGVKYADLVSVLNFMYHGEVSVAQEELNSFLAVAEDLQVRGLSQKSSNRDVKPHNKDLHRREHIGKPDTKPIPPKKQPQPAPPQIPTVPCPAYQNENDDIQEIVPVKSEPLPAPTEAQAKSYTAAMVEQTYYENNQQHQEVMMADANMEYGEEYTDYGYEGYEDTEEGYGSSVAGAQVENKALDDLIAKSMSQILDETGSRIWNCDLCNRNNKSKQVIRRHMEIHLQVQHQCPHCEKQVQTREALRRHISRYHKY